MVKCLSALNVLAVVLTLAACTAQSPVDTCVANPDAIECQPLSCESEPDGCQKASVLLETTLKASNAKNPAEYGQGDSMVGEISVWIDDPDTTISVGSVFINLVECIHPEPTKECFNTTQRDFRSVFDQSSFSIEPAFYNKTYTGDQLRAGLNISLAGKINASARPAKYDLVIQIFECRNTDPNKVGNDPYCPRIGLADYVFNVPD